jgi:hypothetical protein
MHPEILLFRFVWIAKIPFDLVGIDGYVSLFGRSIT